MSLFPRFHEITPIFRLIDEYDRVARQAFPAAHTLSSFNPKFDVREVADQYELIGELPGIEQSNVNIEWTDGNTLTISGRAEHRSERGTRPQATETAETTETNEDESSSKKATVEDAQDDGELVEVEKPESSAEVAAPAAQEVEKPAETKAKYWVTERSVGQFNRTFSFPARVDQDNVKASLKNGVLNVVVPKAKPKEPRRINID